MYVREKDWGFWQNEFYEPEETALIKQLVKPDWICMDIGANIGYFTILMAKQCKFVYAFEPELSNVKLWLDNIGLNDLIPKTTIYSEAVGDKNGTMPLYLCPTNNGMHRLYKSKWCSDKTDTYVYTTQLDDYKFSKIDFIKMDIEGAEYGALNGMVELLIKDHPTIMMEFHPMSIKEYGINPEKVHEFITRLGYNISVIPQIDWNLTYEQLITKTNDESGGKNILCQ